MRAWALMLSLMMLAGAGCRNGETPRPAGPPAPPSTSAQAVYQSDEAGFRFALPASWQGGYRVDAKHGDAARAVQPGADHVVTFFYVPLAAGAHDEPLLRLMVLPRSQWTALSNQSGPPAGTVVSDRADRVYLASVPANNPYGAGTPDGRRFADMMPSIDEVRRQLTLRP